MRAQRCSTQEVLENVVLGVDSVVKRSRIRITGRMASMEQKYRLAMCHRKSEDFNKLDKNISEGLQTQSIDLYLNHQSDAKQR